MLINVTTKARKFVEQYKPVMAPVPSEKYWPRVDEPKLYPPKRTKPPPGRPRDQG